MSEWFPIETAPKDGSELLIGGWYSDDLLPIEMSESRQVEWWCREVYWTKISSRHKSYFWAIIDFYDDGTPIEFDNPFPAPTHWAHKPAAPMAPEGYRMWPRDFSATELGEIAVKSKKDQAAMKRQWRQWDKATGIRPLPEPPK